MGSSVYPHGEPDAALVLSIDHVADLLGASDEQGSVDQANDLLVQLHDEKVSCRGVESRGKRIRFVKTGG